jgi:hypothetical protein
MISFSRRVRGPSQPETPNTESDCQGMIELSMTIWMTAMTLDLNAALRALTVLGTVAAHRPRRAFAGRVSALLCYLYSLHNYNSLERKLRPPLKAAAAAPSRLARLHETYVRSSHFLLSAAARLVWL